MLNWNIAVTTALREEIVILYQILYVLPFLKCPFGVRFVSNFRDASSNFAHLIALY